MGLLRGMRGGGDPAAPGHGSDMVGVDAEVDRRATGRLTNVVERMSARHEGARVMAALREAGLEPAGGPAGRARVEGALLTLIYLFRQGLGDTDHLRRTLEGEVGLAAADAGALASLAEGRGGEGEDAGAIAAWVLGGTPLAWTGPEPDGTGTALELLGVHALVAAEAMRDPAMPLLARQQLLIEVMGEGGPAAPPAP